MQSIKPHHPCFHVINECAQTRTDVAHSINDGTRFDYSIGVILYAISIKFLHRYALNHGFKCAYASPIPSAFHVLLLLRFFLISLRFALRLTHIYCKRGNSLLLNFSTSLTLLCILHFYQYTASKYRFCSSIRNSVHHLIAQFNPFKFIAEETFAIE